MASQHQPRHKNEENTQVHWACDLLSLLGLQPRPYWVVKERGVFFWFSIPSLLVVAALAHPPMASVPKTLLVSLPLTSCHPLPPPVEPVVEQEADWSLLHFQMALKQVPIPLSLSKRFVTSHF